MRSKVLIVDDQPDMLRVLRRELAPEFEVVEAANGADAIAILEHDSQFAAVVSDFAMGAGPNGGELLQLVADRLPAAVRVLVTGTPGALREMPDSSGAEIVFDKPWKRGAILAHLLSRLSRDR